MNEFGAISCLLRGDLYVPGYCDNPDDEVPLLNVRIFDDVNKIPVICVFSTFSTLEKFFIRSGIESLKYMRLKSPFHFESAIQSDRDLIIDFGTSSEFRLSATELKCLAGTINW